MKHSKYYYDYKRNMDTNNKTALETAKERNVPDYYIGSVYGYEARKVIEDWDLSYNVGVAVSYLLRCNYKHDSPFEDIQKAINHLNFELDKLNNREQ